MVQVSEARAAGGARGRDEDVAYLVRYLLEERGLAQAPAEGRPFDEAFAEFRALVNTREPRPADGRFLAVQDRLLRGLIAQAGIARAAELPPTPADARLSVWRGDITTLEADAIVLKRGEQRAPGLLGAGTPLHRQRHPHVRRRAAAPGVRGAHGAARTCGAHRPRAGHGRIQPACPLGAAHGGPHRGRRAHRTAPARAGLVLRELPRGRCGARVPHGRLLLRVHRRVRLPAKGGCRDSRGHGARLARSAGRGGRRCPRQRPWRRGRGGARRSRRFGSGRLGERFRAWRFPGRRPARPAASRWCSTCSATRTRRSTMTCSASGGDAARAAELPQGARRVLIGAGAGLSAAAGLSYGGERFARNFAPFIEKYGMTDMYSAGFYPFPSEEARWGYWARHVWVNRHEPDALPLYRALHAFARERATRTASSWPGCSRAPRTASCPPSSCPRAPCAAARWPCTCAWTGTS